MKKKYKILWHTSGNILAIADETNYLPEFYICDDEYTGETIFTTYPMEYMDYYGWIVIGEI